jgi:ribonuclease P protein component
MAVSRKVGKAVVRNRIKRYIREIYRTHRAELPEDVHLVVVARPAAARLNYAQALQAIRQLLPQGTALRG